MKLHKIKVGTNQLGYNQKRNFVDLPFKNVSFKKVFDINKIVTYPKYKILGKVDYKLINRFNDFGLNDVQLYHFFNTLTPVKKPWIVTFETTLPRLDPDFRRGYDWMSGSHCKKIIAYSRRAYSGQLELLNMYPSYQSEIANKMTMLLPSQKMMIENLRDKNFDDKITCTFVGGAFYRKGGWELLQAFERLKEFHSEIRLNIISSLGIEGYKDDHITKQMKEETLKMLTDNPAINYYPSLPNKQVLEILKRSHVGILPSWGETFGYSILEAMACGCAVIVPDVSPFPEFVDSECGWLIGVNKTFRGGIEDSEISTENSMKMIDGLACALHGTLNDRESLYSKCNHALNRIFTNHNPYRAASFLEDLYEEVVY